jgi:hypothetical protein
MDVDDVPYRGSSGEGPPQSRLTLQHVGDVDDPVFLDSSFMQNNCDARQPDDASGPPTFLLDFAYACVALARWGAEPFRKLARDRAQAGYYRGDVAHDGAGRGARKRKRGDERDVADGQDGEDGEGVEGAGGASRQRAGGRAPAKRRKPSLGWI